MVELVTQVLTEEEMKITLNFSNAFKYRFARAKRGSALPIGPLRGHSEGIGEAQCEACPPQIS